MTSTYVCLVAGRFAH